MSRKFISGLLAGATLLGAVGFASFAGATTTLTPEQITCIQTAVETRDSGIITAANTFNTSIDAALTTRKDSIKTAWGLASMDQIKPALTAAWTAYKASATSARSTYKTTRDTLWTAFRTTRINDCHVGSDGNGSPSDAAL